MSFTKDTTTTSITLNDNNILTTPKIVASGINETNEMGGAKSFQLTTSLSSTQDNVSPVLDVDSIGVIGIQNRINNVDAIGDVSQATDGNFVDNTGLSASFVPSADPKGDSNAAVYCTKKVVLENPANAIHVLFDGYRATDGSGLTSGINVYYKIQGPDSNVPFNDLGWTRATIKTAVPADASATAADSKAPAEGLEDFNSFSIKLTLQSDNTSNVPLVENFRAIALST